MYIYRCMASFWASLHAGRVDRQGSVSDNEVDHHAVESDAHAENPPELTDVDSESDNDCDEEPPDLIEADSDNDVDQDTARQRKRRNVADEFAVDENTIRPRCAYTFTKRQRKASKPRCAVSTQRGKAEEEALCLLCLHYGSAGKDAARVFQMLIWKLLLCAVTTNTVRALRVKGASGSPPSCRT